MLELSNIFKSLTSSYRLLIVKDTLFTIKPHTFLAIVEHFATKHKFSAESWKIMKEEIFHLVKVSICKTFDLFTLRFGQVKTNNIT